MSSKILLTGQPGVGKTTILDVIVQKAQSAGISVEGIIGHDVLAEDGSRIGFEVATMYGDSVVFAHKTDIRSEIQVPSRDGRPYQLDMTSFNSIALPALQHSLENHNALIVIDEIGEMESHSPEFIQACITAFEQSERIIAITTPGVHPWNEAIIDIPNVTSIEVTADNRESVLESITSELGLGEHEHLREARP